MEFAVLEGAAMTPGAATESPRNEQRNTVNLNLWKVCTATPSF